MFRESSEEREIKGTGRITVSKWEGQGSRNGLDQSRPLFQDQRYQGVCVGLGAGEM